MAAFTVLHGCSTIQLGGERKTLVDASDYARFGVLRWHVRNDRYGGYAGRTVTIDGRRINEKLHRVIMGDPPKTCIDHRDGDTFNNTRSNLRLATKAQNSRNRRRSRCDSQSKFKGVGLDRNGWRARIMVDGVSTSLGYFDTEEQAAEAYDMAAIRLHGEFACTNAELGRTIVDRDGREAS